MSHPDLLLLSQLLDDELPAADAAPLRDHVAACPTCRARRDRLERALARARDAGREMDERAAAAAPAPNCLRPDEVAGYVQRMLDSSARQRADAHLAVCDACVGDVAGVLRMMAALDAAPAIPVPAALAARVASRWDAPAEDAALTRLVIRVARAGVELLERHVVSPLRDVVVIPIPAPAIRGAATDGAALGFRIQAPTAQIEVTVFPEGDGVALGMTLIGTAGSGLAGERVFLRQRGRSIYSARTAEDGSLRMPRLEPGVYEISCPGIATTFRLDLRA